MDTGSDHAVLVVGMHRSGTSAVTRVVNLLGVPLARSDDLVGPSDANPTGYWESASLVAFNERLLRSLGGSTWQPPDHVHPHLVTHQLSSLLPEGRRLLAALHAHRAWAWKDPRNCLTLPFWRECLASCEVSIVFVFRQPTAVARSLARRDGVSLAYALGLWEHYNRHALQGIHGLTVSFVDYDELVTDPLGQAERLQRFLRARGIDVPDPLPEISIRALIGAGTQSRRPPEPAHAEPALTPPQVETLWCLLRSLRDSSAFTCPNLERPSHLPAGLQNLYRRDLPRRVMRKGIDRLRRTG